MQMYEIDKSLLEKIDALELSERNQQWRAAMKAAPWRVYVDQDAEEGHGQCAHQDPSLR